MWIDAKRIIKPGRARIFIVMFLPGSYEGPDLDKAVSIFREWSSKGVLTRRRRPMGKRSRSISRRRSDQSRKTLVSEGRSNIIRQLHRAGRGAGDCCRPEAVQGANWRWRAKHSAKRKGSATGQRKRPGLRRHLHSLSYGRCRP